MSNAESPGELQTPGRLAYLAELQCFMCGNVAGSIESDRKPLPPHGIWHPAGGSPTQHVADWHQVRCSRCGGALYAESVETVVRHAEPDETHREAPRRGRPPKWLIEQRRQMSEAAETRL